MTTATELTKEQLLTVVGECIEILAKAQHAHEVAIEEKDAAAEKARQTEQATFTAQMALNGATQDLADHLKSRPTLDRVGVLRRSQELLSPYA